jgi:hypothetical protein
MQTHLKSIDITCAAQGANHESCARCLQAASLNFDARSQASAQPLACSRSAEVALGCVMMRRTTPNKHEVHWSRIEGIRPFAPERVHMQITHIARSYRDITDSSCRMQLQPTIRVEDTVLALRPRRHVEIECREGMCLRLQSGDRLTDEHADKRVLLVHLKPP